MRWQEPDLPQCPGSGGDERKTLLTRQIAFEPLPASILFALGWLSAGYSTGVIVVEPAANVHQSRDKSPH
jgi:hypothetical protein